MDSNNNDLIKSNTLVVKSKIMVSRKSLYSKIFGLKQQTSWCVVAGGFHFLTLLNILRHTNMDSFKPSVFIILAVQTWNILYYKFLLFLCSTVYYQQIDYQGNPNSRYCYIFQIWVTIVLVLHRYGLLLYPIFQ